MLRLSIVLFLVLAVAGLVAVGLRHLPPQWDPRAPLDLTAPPNVITGLKLRRLSGDAEMCFLALETAPRAVRRVPDRASDGGCPIENAALLPASISLRPNTPVVTCRMAAAWTLFERNTLQPAARAHLGAEIVAIRHLGAYACRNVNHASSGRRSQHATANAIDIAGFVLENGREISLTTQWRGEGGEAAFLRSVRDGACRWFRAVLGPDYNAAHHDHFHFDMGTWRICR